MSSTVEELAANQKELAEFRLVVDDQIDQTIETLNQGGFESIATHLQTDFKAKLNHGREVVDFYANIPQIYVAQFNHAIFTMFDVWDESRKYLNDLMKLSKSKDSKMSNYFISILVLTDMLIKGELLQILWHL